MSFLEKLGFGKKPETAAPVEAEENVNNEEEVEGEAPKKGVDENVE